MNLLTLITWLWISIGTSAPTATVSLKITELPSNQGKLLVTMYAEDDEWLDEEVAFYTAFVAVTA